MIGDYVRVLRLFSRDMRLFLVSAATVGLAWEGMRAVLLNLYLLRLGYGPELIGLITGVGTLVFGLVCLPAGAIGTRWGNRRPLIGGLVLMVAGCALVPCAELVPDAWRLGWLLATSSLTNVGFAAYLVSGLPFQMATTGPAERNHAFSFYVALMPLAGMAGSLVGGALPGWIVSLQGASLDDPMPYRLPLWLAAAVLVPGVLALLQTRPDGDWSVSEPAAGPERNDAARVPWALLLVVGLIMALRFGGRGAVVTFFNIYLDQGLDTTPALIGGLVAAAQLISVPAALVAPLVVARWGAIATIFWASSAMVLMVLPLALIPHPAAAGLSYMSSTAFFSLTVGPIRLFSQELVAPRWRASMAAVFMMGPGVAFAATSLGGGYVITLLGYGSLFLGAAGLMAASAAVFGLYFSRGRGEIATQLPAEPVLGPEIGGAP